MQNITITPAYNHIKEIKELFTEYIAMLIEAEDNFEQYLQIQNYDSELDNLEKKYGLPNGRLYIAYYREKLAGCIGLRKLDDTTCEMKRLYVKPDFRGKSIGNALVEQIITDAKEIGYSRMLLDTLPVLQSAIRLYKKYGFYNIPAYNDSPVEKTLFMQLDL